MTPSELTALAERVAHGIVPTPLADNDRHALVVTVRKIIRDIETTHDIVPKPNSQ